MKNFKLVKTTAALALGASVVTAAVVPGATDASAASKYKVSHGKLVNAKTGKVVKGYVVFKSKLYHNGKLRQGYKTVGTGKSIKLYFNGSLKKGYKTARNNKLLFQNGSLKKGWKTAGAGERLYKNGFLSKGYEVYGDLDKSPSLYYNGYLKSGYKTANNASLLFYNGKLKAGLKDAKGGTVLYDNGRLSKGLVEFKEKFYNDGKLANGEINGTFYKDGVAVSDVASVKALNSTTIEVTFKHTVTADDAKASRFAIEGLEVKNAAVKQSDDKVVVLTTATQEAGKTYTLSVDGVKAMTFAAKASDVIPTSIELSTPSQQGVLGKEVTVSTKVTVKEGQSKAGIPVTFNIASGDKFNDDKVVEVQTDENGVAKYSYTRYHSGEDKVYAYPTGAADVKSTVGKVYWANAVQLDVTELTSGNDLANNTKKSYKVTGEANTTYYVAIKENLNVTPDKITDIKVQDHGTQNFVTPYELTTGGTSYATVVTNAKGEGSFTVYGSNLEATPIVYLPSTVGNTKAYSKLALQSEAPKVKFSQVDRLAITAAGEGTANSAEYYQVPVAYDANSAGGRTYTVTVTDKDGKVAPEGTVAYVSFNDMKGDVYFSTEKANFKKVALNDVQPITVGKNGKAQFRVAGKGDTTYVKPTIFLNTAGTTTPVVLDKSDVQIVADTTYFKTPVVTNAELKVTDAKGNVITSRAVGEDAYFTYQSVDQNGFAYRPGSYTTEQGSTTVVYKQVERDGVIYFEPITITTPAITQNEYVLAFDVTSTFGDSEVKDANGNKLSAVQNLGTTKTYHVKSNAEGQAVVRVTSKSADTISVNVTGASNVLPTTTAKVTFTKYTSDEVVTGLVSAVDTVKETLTITEAGKDKVYNYTAEGTKYSIQGQATSLKGFLDVVNGARVTATKDSEGNVTFNVIATGTSVPQDLAAAQSKVDNATINGSKDATLKNVKTKLTLSGDGVVWTSNKPAVIATDGTVNRPSYKDGDATVELTATFTENGQKASKVFTVTVSKVDASTDATLKSDDNYTLGTAVEGKADLTIAEDTSVAVESLKTSDNNADVKVVTSTDAAKTTGNLAAGDKVVVTAEDGTTIITYTVKVTVTP